MKSEQPKECWVGCCCCCNDAVQITCCLLGQNVLLYLCASECVLPRFKNVYISQNGRSACVRLRQVCRHRHSRIALRVKSRCNECEKHKYTHRKENMIIQNLMRLYCCLAFHHHYRAKRRELWNFNYFNRPTRTHVFGNFKPYLHMVCNAIANKKVRWFSSCVRIEYQIMKNQNQKTMRWKKKLSQYFKVIQFANRSVLHWYWKMQEIEKKLGLSWLKLSMR